MVGWLDIVLGIILIGTFIAGLIRGLVKEIVGLVAVVTGFIVAARYYPLVSGFFEKIVHNPAVVKFCGFIVLFLAILILGSLAAFLISKLMIGPLKLVNHMLGGLFGLLEGVLICGVFVFALLVFPINTNALANSKLAPYCYGLTKALVTLIPQELKDQFNDAYQNIVKSEKTHGQKI
jgi:membrane protein required for colicin V production